jgi:hypothetical protein
VSGWNGEGVLDVLQNGDRDDDVQGRRPIDVEIKLHSAITTLGVVGADIGYIDICLT